MTKKQPDHGSRILYEDQDLLVCVKPAGIAAQTKKSGQQDMVSLLRNYRHANGEEPYIGLVHRLAPASGRNSRIWKTCREYRCTKQTADTGELCQRIPGSSAGHDASQGREAGRLFEKRRTRKLFLCRGRERTRCKKSRAAVPGTGNRCQFTSRAESGENPIADRKASSDPGACGDTAGRRL